MVKYHEFLEKINVICEEQFCEIANMFPDVSIDDIEIDSYYYDLDESDCIARLFIESIVNNYDYAYLDEVNFNDKTITLEDIQSLEDLEDIKNRLSNWNILNYNDIKEDIIKEMEEEKEEERIDEERRKKISIINSVVDNITLEEIKELANKYDNKR